MQPKHPTASTSTQAPPQTSSDLTPSELTSLTEKHRLPCRGCKADCVNYASCNGQLWRMPPKKS